VRRDIAPVRYLGLQALACLYKREPDRDLALDLARKSAARAGASGWTAEALGYLGEVHAARCETEDALRAFERAVALPGCYRSTGEDLAALRKALYPRLASCASVDAFLRGDKAEAGKGIDDLPAVRGRLEAGSPVARSLEASLLESEGRDAEARGILEDLAARSPEAEDALVLRLARLRAGAGELEAANRNEKAPPFRANSGFVPPRRSKMSLMRSRPHILATDTSPGIRRSARTRSRESEACLQGRGSSRC
jgi:tetratricopeptide (TPR) repeat protein